MTHSRDKDVGDALAQTSLLKTLQNSGNCITHEEVIWGVDRRNEDVGDAPADLKVIQVMGLVHSKGIPLPSEELSQSGALFFSINSSF